MSAVEYGSFTRAATELGVNRTTVARRISALEKQLGAVLLEQSVSGYQLSATGIEVLDSARKLEQLVQNLEEKISTEHTEVYGPLRVALPLGLGSEFMPEFRQFTDTYPGIDLELINSLDPVVSINQRKADAGIGLAHSLPGYIYGQQLGELHRAIYASKNYLKQHADTAHYHEHRWVGWGKELAHSKAAQWMDRHVSNNAHIALRVNSWHALREAVLNDIGVGTLWCFLADQEKQLEKIGTMIPELSIGLWVLRHREMQNNKRVDAFVDFMGKVISTKLAP